VLATEEPQPQAVLPIDDEAWDNDVRYSKLDGHVALYLTCKGHISQEVVPPFVTAESEHGKIRQACPGYLPSRPGVPTCL
jgi:hypothetical protein